MEALGLLYLAAGPGIAIAVYIYYSDKWEPEPKGLVIKCFILGALACFPAIYYKQVFNGIFGLERIFEPGYQATLWEIACFAFFGVALGEELCKFFFLKVFAYDDREFNEPFDGIIYGGIVGCGFATFENIEYVFKLGYEVGLVRIITAVPSHAFEGIVLGYFFGKAKFSPNPWNNLLKGLGLVILLHGIYDTVAFSKTNLAFIPIFVLVVLGIYLGLKARRVLQKQSEVVEFSTKEFFLLKNGGKQGPLLLKEIRGLLADGSVELDDVVIGRGHEKKRTIREVLYLTIGSQHQSRVKIPSQGQPLKEFLIIYAMTFGLYLYFWFYRNYKQLNDYKNLGLNPELRALGLFVFSIIAIFVYGVILRALNLNPYDPVMRTPTFLVLAGIETSFLFFQFRIIKKILGKTLEKTFSLFIIVPVYFILVGIGNLLPLDFPQYWWIEFLLVLLMAVVLTNVQKDLNRYWQLEREKTD